MTGLRCRRPVTFSSPRPSRSPPVPPARDRPRGLRLPQRRRRRSTATTSSASTTTPAWPRWPSAGGRRTAAARGLPRLRRAGLGDERRRGDRLGGPTGLRCSTGGARRLGVRVGQAARRLGLGLRLEPDEPPRAAEERRSTPRSSRRAPSRRASTGCPPPGRASSWWGPPPTPRRRPALGGGRRSSAATRRAVRARFLVKDTDVALVASAGKNQRTLFGLDLGRDVGGSSPSTPRPPSTRAPRCSRPATARSSSAS